MTIGHNFILEGIDGTGKTTIACRLDAELNDKIKTSLMTSSPFDLPIGRMIKEILINPTNDLDWQTETLLFATLFRYHHHAFTKHTDRGDINICDRGYRSTLAYQIANGGNMTDILNVLDIVYDDKFHYNTDIIVLDTDDITNGLGRTEMDRFTDKGVEYYTKVRDNYREFSHDMYTHFVNADRPLEEVYQDVKAIIVTILKEKDLID